MALALRIDLVNVGTATSSAELRSFLENKLPLEAVFRLRPPPRGVPMAEGAGADWMVILQVGASAVTVATALWQAYQRFVPRAGHRAEKTGTGLLVEIRNARDDFRLVKIGEVLEGGEVVIKQISESLELVASQDDGKGDDLKVKAERSETWFRVR